MPEMDCIKALEQLMEQRPEDVIRYVKDNELVIENRRKSDYYLRSFTKKMAVDIKPLSDEQLAELHRVWGGFEQDDLYDPAWNAIYTSVTGKFDPYYIPQNLHYLYVERSRLDRSYQIAFSDKNYLSLLFPSIKQPRTIARKMKGIYLDENYQKIDLNQVLSLIRQNKDIGVVVKKSRESSGGKGVSFITSDTNEEEILTILRSGNELQVQECVRQHPDMAALNPSSVNTIRMMTMLMDGEVILLSSVVRIGNTGSRLDNLSSGGVSCGILPDGRLTETGYQANGRRFAVHPNGLHFQDAQIPNYEKIVEIVKRQHYFIPMLGVVSWDICISEEADPVLIEINVGEGGIGLHQYNNGPLYGEYREKILTDTFAHSYVPGATLDYSYRCYPKRCTIVKGSKYISSLAIPEVINGRNVTRIGNNAFIENRSLISVALPNTIRSIGETAFFSCRNLQHVTFGRDLDIIERSAFNECMSLKTADLPDGMTTIGTRAFWDCHALTAIRIPSSVTYIGNGAFGHSSQVVIYCDKGSFAEKYAVENGIPYRESAAYYEKDLEN